MSRPESRLLSSIAEGYARRLVRRVIRQLQSLDGDSTMLPQDTGLSNIWDEVCLQVQSGESTWWDVYLVAISDYFTAELEDVPPTHEQAMWLQTDRGEDWLMAAWGEEEAGEPVVEIPIDRSHVVEWLGALLLQEAASWSNRRIRAAIDAGW